MSRVFPTIIALFAGVTLARGALAADTCFNDWSVAAPIVLKEGLVTVEQLTPRARDKFKGDIVKVTLCQENGAYVFRLVVRGAAGDLKTVTVDAKNPF